MNQHSHMLEAFALADCAAAQLSAVEGHLASVQGAEDLNRRALLLRGEIQTFRDAVDHQRIILFQHRPAQAAR